MEWIPGRPKTSLGLRGAPPNNNDKKPGRLKRVKSTPLLSTLGRHSSRTPTRPSTPSPDVPSVIVAPEFEEQLQQILFVSRMAQITKDSLDRIFVELKSKYVALLTLRKTPLTGFLQK